MWPYSPTPGHVSGEKHPKGCMHPIVYCSTVYSSQDREAAYKSIERGVDAEDVVHIYNGILLSH